MTRCDYFACTEEIDYSDSEGFRFCCYHLECLENIIATDLASDGYIDSVAYCFQALNDKAYLRSNTLL